MSAQKQPIEKSGLALRKFKVAKRLVRRGRQRVGLSRHFKEKCSLRVFKAPSRVPGAKILVSNVLERVLYVTPKVDGSTAEKLHCGYERAHQLTASPGLTKPLSTNIRVTGAMAV